MKVIEVEKLVDSNISKQIQYKKYLKAYMDLTENCSNLKYNKEIKEVVSNDLLSCIDNNIYVTRNKNII